MAAELPHPRTRQCFVSPVPPGTGWPGDPAAERGTALGDLGADISTCRRCPRLVEWREQVALAKRASYAEQPYWGRPIAGFGSTVPRILVVGLAPAAHGANRTGRVFTGDRSGDWLFASLHRVGLASQPTSTDAADGLELIDTRMVAAVRCAPPQNKPTTDEIANCAPWLDRELALITPSLRVVVALGGIGWEATLRAVRRAGWDVPRPKPRFGHGAEVILTASPTDQGSDQVSEQGSDRQSVTLLGCYHPSQQNTFTGRLTEPMLDDVLGRAAHAARMTG
ncbi:MAG: uracil-DNA glycosylase [Nocardioides sp.]